MGKETSLKILLFSARSCRLVHGAMAQLTAHAQPGSSDATCSLAATRDSVCTRRVSVYEACPAFKGLVAVIREADAGFTNLEISLIRMADFTGYPQVEAAGYGLSARPRQRRISKFAELGACWQPLDFG